MQVTEYIDYRTLLKEALNEKKTSLGKVFTHKCLAESCKIQNTYLSKVLNGRAHLSSDQLYLAAHYLGFNREDIDYIFLLFEEMRTHIPQRRAELQTQIRQLQQLRLKSESRLQTSPLTAEGLEFADYYLDPNFQIVHMFLTIDRYAQQPSTIADRLHLDPERLVTILSCLQRLGIIEMRGARYHVVKESVHLSKDSTLYRPYRSLLRMKTIEKMDRTPSEKSYNFSVIFGSHPKIRQKIQTAFLDFLQQSQQWVSKSKSENVYQMNFDLFEWD